MARVVEVGENAIELIKTAMGVQTMAFNVRLIERELETLLLRPRDIAPPMTPTSPTATPSISTINKAMNEVRKKKQEELALESELIYWEEALAKGRKDFMEMNNKFRATHSKLLTAIAQSVRGAMQFV
mgnify:CR=1 FL=1